MKSLNIYLFLVALIMGSCFSNKFELVGEKKVQGSSKMFFRIYQKDEFEHYTPLQVELWNESGILIPRKYLTGTDVSKEKIDRFYGKLEANIFYICYPYPKIYFIQNLDSTMSYLSRDELFDIVNLKDINLIDANK